MSTHLVEQEESEAQVLQVLGELESKTYRLTELLGELERRLDAILKPDGTETCDKLNLDAPDLCPLSIAITAQIRRTKGSIDQVGALLERLAI